MKKLDAEKKEKQKWLKQVGIHIQAVRKSKGMSIGEVANACIMNKSNLIRIEQGRTNTTIFRLKQICNAMVISMEDF